MRLWKSRPRCGPIQSNPINPIQWETKGRGGELVLLACRGLGSGWISLHNILCNILHVFIFEQLTDLNCKLKMQKNWKFDKHGLRN
jgi:hypothetical protein